MKIDSQSIIVNNNIYILDLNEDGRAKINTYNKKHKILVNINFQQQSSNIKNKIIEILKNDYIEKIAAM